MTRSNRNQPTGFFDAISQRMSRNHLLTLTFLFTSILLLFLFYSYYARTILRSNSAPIIVENPPGAPVAQRHAQSNGPLRIGLISGHMGSDSGAVCDDGLTEAQINLDVSEKTKSILESRGFAVDLLAEYDSRLNGYAGDAVVGIQADSCTGPAANLTGFKTAAAVNPGSGQLETCVRSHYAAGTQLPFDANTITPDMRQYHAFYDVPTTVPIIIIEMGFMNRDRELLTSNSIVPATAIADGIVCFVEQQVQ